MKKTTTHHPFLMIEKIKNKNFSACLSKPNKHTYSQMTCNDVTSFFFLSIILGGTKQKTLTWPFFCSI